MQENATWICRNCGQDVEDDFEVCWNCQFDRTGSPPPPIVEQEKLESGETKDPLPKYPFHWGAFFLTSLWLLFNGNVGMGAILIAMKILSSRFGIFGFVVGYVVVLVIALNYGSRAYKILWETGRYDSLAEMKRQQLPWTIAGIVLGLIEILFYIYAVFKS